MEMFGSAVVEVDENLKIVDLQVFFDPHDVLGRLMRKTAADDGPHDNNFGDSRCPFLH